MSIFRTIAMFIYLFGYMIVHYGVLRRAERALAAATCSLWKSLSTSISRTGAGGIFKG